MWQTVHMHAPLAADADGGSGSGALSAPAQTPAAVPEVPALAGVPAASAAPQLTAAGASSMSVPEFLARFGGGNVGTATSAGSAGPDAPQLSAGGIDAGVACVRGRLSMVRLSGKVIFVQLRDADAGGTGGALRVVLGQREWWAGLQNLGAENGV